MADKNWKKTERAVAELLGGKRVPVTGRQRGDTPDIEHPYLAIEVKHRKIIPEWILDAMDQAIASATVQYKDERISKTPIVILHKERTRHENDLVLISISDFKAIIEERTV